MERRTMQVLDVRDMKSLKGGVKTVLDRLPDTGNGDGGGIPPGGY